MSKVYFSVSFPHDNPIKPKFSVATNNLYGIDVQGTDITNAKLGNGNLNKGWKNRFEYAIKTQKGVTSMSLIVNTSMVLPHASWSPKPRDDKIKSSKERYESDGDEDGRYKSSQRRLRSSDESEERSSRHRRRHSSDHPDRKVAVRNDKNENIRHHKSHRTDCDSDSEHRRPPRSSHPEGRRRRGGDGSRRPRRIAEDQQWLAEDNNDGGMGDPIIGDD